MRALDCAAPPTVEAVELFAAELFLRGCASQCRQAVSAVMSHVGVVGWPRSLKDTVDGIEAQYHLEGGGGRSLNAQRQPLPAVALVQFCSQAPPAVGSAASFAFIRDCAMATLAWRLMLRDGDVLSLDWENVRFGAEHDAGHADWLFVQPLWAKGNRGAPIDWRPVDPSDGLACPVRWMFQWASLTRPASRSGPVFVNVGDGRRGHRGARLASGYLTLLARKIATSAGLSGHFAGHSFRIGGATALAATPGVNLQEVMAVGGWASEVALRYMRNIGLAAKGVTRRLGL